MPAVFNAVFWVLGAFLSVLLLMVAFGWLVAINDFLNERMKK